MNPISDKSIYCPYCGERYIAQIDCTEETQDYIEDCQICCRPISFHVAIADKGEPRVSVYSENEIGLGR